MKEGDKCSGLVLCLREVSRELLKKERLRLWVSYQNVGVRVMNALISVHRVSEECGRGRR